MREMCKNFACNQSCGQSPCMQAPAALNPDTTMGDCNTCVWERIGFAQAMVPFQPYETPKGQEQSLICGTVFDSLSMPYCDGWNLYRFGKGAEA